MSLFRVTLAKGQRFVCGLFSNEKVSGKAGKVIEHKVKIGEHWTGVKVKESESTLVDGIEVLNREYNFTPKNQLLHEKYYNRNTNTTVENNYAIHESGFRINKDKKVMVGNDTVYEKEFDQTSGKISRVMRYNPVTKEKREINYTTHETGIRIKDNISYEKDGVELLHKEYDPSTGKIDYIMKFNPQTNRRIERCYFTHDETGYRLLGGLKVSENDVVVKLKKYGERRGELKYHMEYDPKTDVKVEVFYELAPSSGLNTLRRRYITANGASLMDEVYPFYGEDPTKIKWLNKNSRYYSKTAIVANRPSDNGLLDIIFDFQKLYKEYKTYAKAAIEDIKDLCRNKMKSNI